MLGPRCEKAEFFTAWSSTFEEVSLSCSVAPVFSFFVAAPLKNVFPKKGSLLFQGH